MFMTKRRHEAEIADYATDLKRANEARDNWKASSKEWEAKFKKAATDLAAQSDEIVSLKRTVENQSASIEKLLPDATAMRRKRARDREQKALARKGRVQ